MKSNALIFSLLACFCSQLASGQAPDFDLEIRRATGPITVDGLLEEADWGRAEMATHFKINFPVDSIYSSWPTEARLTFDDKNIYVGYTCFENREDYTVQSLRRDFPGGTSDVINLLLDPFRDGQNGFIFSVNPLNVQREGLIANGENLNLIWDNKWRSAVKNYDDRWTVEIAIPFRTLRYKLAAGGQPNRWNINFIRTKLKDFEAGTWRPVPTAYAPQNIAFAGSLIWLDPPPKPGANLSVIPYLTGGISRNFPRDSSLSLLPSKSVFASGIGGDVKIGITPSLNLDLTLNPDFSQVEVDRQVADVSRFELFFPETRQFFLENQDLFEKFGFPSTRPIFSRRIGLARNPLTGENEKIPILGGARLSGKLTDKLRIGLLNMTTERKNWSAEKVNPAANFSVVSLQQRTFARSTLGAIFVNKQNFLDKLTDTQKAGNQPFNRVAGLEYNLYSKDNRWEGEWYYHRSFSPEKRQRGSTWASFIGYSDRHFNARLGYFGVDSFYTAAAGFVPRNAVQGLYPGATFFFWPKRSGWLNDRIRNYSLGANGDVLFDLAGKLADSYCDPKFSLNFKNQSSLSVGMYLDRTTLFEPFDPTRLAKDGEQKLPVGVYKYRGVNFNYTSGTTTDLQGNANLETGPHYNGKFLRLRGDLGYRLQPVGLFTMAFSYFDIRLPKPYATAKFWLIGPKAEVSFRRDLFLSAFFQYNTQSNNFNLNARMQWRFAPVSDVFLVYTDNSFAQEIPGTPVRFFSPKSRAVVLKVVYWLNV